MLAGVEASMRWVDLIPLIFVSGQLRPLRRAGCPYPHNGEGAGERWSTIVSVKPTIPNPPRVLPPWPIRRARGLPATSSRPSPTTAIAIGERNCNASLRSDVPPPASQPSVSSVARCVVDGGTGIERQRRPSNRRWLDEQAPRPHGADREGATFGLALQTLLAYILVFYHLWPAQFPLSVSAPLQLRYL